jgi:hypothetical protein
MVDPPLLVEVIDGRTNCGIERSRIPEHLMGEKVTFQIPSPQFDVIWFRRVTRQPFDRDPASCREGGGAGLRGVDCPLSSTSTTGFAFRRGLDPKRASGFSNRAMKSVLRFVAEVCTMNSRVMAPRTPVIATFRALPGAATRMSAPRFAQAWARWGWVSASNSSA